MIEMNKAILPSILAATILTAGLFAFAPIEKASTVHGTIQGNQLNQIVITTSTDLTTSIRPNCTDNVFQVYYVARGDDGTTFNILQGSEMVAQPRLVGTFEAEVGGHGAGINMATGMVSFEPDNTNIFFRGDSATVDAILTIVGQSDDTCSFTS